MNYRYSNETRLFLKKISFFLLPVILIFFVLEIIVFYSGELIPVKKVVNLQNSLKQKILFGREVADQSIRKYKYLNVLFQKPEVLALGSSRIMQIRGEMFYENTKFYNAGGMVHNIADLVDFVKLLPDYAKPKVIILGVDFYWFGNKRELDYGLSKELDKTDDSYQWKAHLYSDRFLFFQLFKDYSYVKKIFNKKDPINNGLTIGFQALSGNGFRNDGSYQYGNYIKEAEKEIKYIDREGVLDRVNNGTNPFLRNSHFDQERLSFLSEFLEICKKNNIIVIGVAYPFSHDVLNSLENSVYHKELLNDFRNNIPKTFNKFGFEFFDYSDQKTIGINDLYMFDGIHSSETVSAKILLAISNSMVSKNKSTIYKLLPNLLLKLDDKKTTSISINW